MKLFVDTNIFLDVLLERENYTYSLKVLNSCANDIFEGVIADITLLNIDYIARKQTNNIQDFLEIVNDNFNVIGADNKMFKEAFEIDNLDLEDNIQYLCAKNSECNVIVTNDKLFYQGEVDILSSQEFYTQYLS